MPPKVDTAREQTIARVAAALRKAAADHHEYELARGTKDDDWATWYARHMVIVGQLGQPEQAKQDSKQSELARNLHEMHSLPWYETTGCTGE